MNKAKIVATFWLGPNSNGERLDLLIAGMLVARIHNYFDNSSSR